MFANGDNLVFSFVYRVEMGENLQTDRRPSTFLPVTTYFGGKTKTNSPPRQQSLLESNKVLFINTSSEGKLHHGGPLSQLNQHHDI